MRRVLFLSLEQVLIRNTGEASGSDRSWRLMPAVLPSLLALQGAGYVQVLVVHDPERAGTAYVAAALAARLEEIVAVFADQGVVFADVLVCPHRASDDCTCRKPHLGLVRAWLGAEQPLDAARSAVVGAGAEDERFAGNLGVPFLSVPQLGWRAVTQSLLATPRRAVVQRRTNETVISVAVDLDPPAGEAPRRDVQTGIGFFDHMLDQLARHGGFAMTVAVQGDLHIDEHHTVEDTALALGTALRQALGDRVGIGRYGFTLPMDEVLATAALDLSGRPGCYVSGAFSREAVGELPTEMVVHFFQSLAQALGATLHVSVSPGNAHHQVEGAFKAAARALRQAVQLGSDCGVPSTKGVL